MEKPVYKPYHQHQPMLIPLDLNEMVPKDHLVRQIDQVIDGIDTSSLEEQYKGGGTSAYHPVMMLKVVLYAYSQRIFSSRRIAKAARENIHFLWLSRMNQPDFRTINRFRGEKLRKVMEELFYQLVDTLVEKGLIDLEKYFVDGTKMEANANKYSFVWKKNTENYKEKLQTSIRMLFDDVEEIQEWEDELYGENDLNEMEAGKKISSEELQELSDKITEKLKSLPENRNLKKVKKNWKKT